MTSHKSMLALIICLAAIGCSEVEQTASKEDIAKVRIGIYDSRSLAVAAMGSDYYEYHVKPLEDAFRKAKAEENDKLIKELEPKVWERRKQTHRQGFGTAPVDEILEYIKDDIPGIVEEAGIGPIISKWDEAALAKYESAERVDITMLLVDALDPKEQSLKWAIEIQSKPPVPLKELEEQLAREGH